MAKISTGSFDFNKWLYGGYEQGIISVLYGPPGSGKTNLCLMAATSQAKKGKKVIYVDTEGGFSSERIKQILEIKNGNNELNKVLENIIILKPTNFREQKESFGELLKYIKNQISLIIVDGMTMLYRLEFADARQKNNEQEDITALQKVNFELTKQMKILSEIARKQNIPVLVTNQVYNWEKESRMVGGDILKYWGKCLIELTNNDGKRIAYLRKHRSLPEKSFVFYITNEGIKKRGWL